MAARLYAQASTLTLKYAFLGGVMGFLAGCAAGIAAKADTASLGFGLVGGAVGAAIGMLAAAERAFMLRLQAQTILVQVQIERNTRGT
jgi:hypothetical protein